MTQVNHPPHYGGDTPYEAIKVIEAWNLGFNLGNTTKYISRAERKGNPIQDLEKALWYLAREVRLGGGDVFRAIPTPEGEILTAVSLALEHIKEWDEDEAQTTAEALNVVRKVRETLTEMIQKVYPLRTVSGNS